NAPVRRELLGGLLDRIDGRDRHARRLRLLVAGCLETIQELPRDLEKRIETCLAEVIPPRNAAEARVLALAGEEVLLRLPDDLGGLSQARAVATVRTCWLINGSRALRRLAGYRDDPREQVQRELVTGWDYFDPDRYATEVLADAPLLEGRLEVGNPRLLGRLHHLKRLRNLHVSCSVSGGLGFLRGLPELDGLSMYYVHFVDETDIDAIGGLTRLEWLSIHVESRLPADLTPLTRLSELRHLSLFSRGFTGDLAFLDALPRLETLDLAGLESIDDFRPVARQAELVRLHLREAPHLRDPAFFASFPRLRGLVLTGTHVEGGLRALVGHCPGLRSLFLQDTVVGDLDALDALDLRTLNLRGCPVEDLAPLARQRDLESLVLDGVGISGLGPLAELSKLEVLSLEGCSRVTDLSPLTSLTKLRFVDVQGMASDLDLAPLAGKPGLRVLADPAQRFRNAHLLHHSAKIERL
ncbi:leucine-rich repeat domain-containing protein, partial [Streptosporangium algeriense]